MYWHRQRKGHRIGGLADYSVLLQFVHRNDASRALLQCVRKG